MACETERQRIKDLAQQIKDFQEIQKATFLSKAALQVAWAWKYGTQDVGILQLRTDLDNAYADLAACELTSGVESVAGKWAADALRSLWKLTD